MRLIRPTLLSILLAAVAATPVAALDNVLFLHHSTGRNLIDEGGMRSAITQLNQSRGVPVQFWDHDYNAIGLRNPAGGYTGVSYDIPGDNTDPDGLYALWTTANPARAQILQNHQVIAFKSCYPASDVGSDAELAPVQDLVPRDARRVRRAPRQDLRRHLAAAPAPPDHRPGRRRPGPGLRRLAGQRRVPGGARQRALLRPLRPPCPKPTTAPRRPTCCAGSTSGRTAATTPTPTPSRIWRSDRFSPPS